MRAVEPKEARRQKQTCMQYEVEIEQSVHSPGLHRLHPLTRLNPTPERSGMGYRIGTA